MSSLALSLSLLAFSVSADSGAETNSYSRFARLALDCLHREYPNKIAHVLQGDRDAKPPRELTPVFFGCLDWHSAVHGHWLLVRLCRLDSLVQQRSIITALHSFQNYRISALH